MTNGATVQAFESAFADFVSAKYAIASSNGTVTLQAALRALGVQPGDRVAAPPLTMSATSISILNVGAVPMFVDVDARTWLMQWDALHRTAVSVSLYGLCDPSRGGSRLIDDAAQTLRRHSGAAFTSYSFQASKILSTGEGGMLVTNDEALAERARSYLSLGYRLRADQPRIDPHALKAPTFERHFLPQSINGRMNDITASLALGRLKRADQLLADRREAAALYRDELDGYDWLTPQFVPDGWTFDAWTFAVACDTPQRALSLQNAVEKYGGERPYAAWRLTYDEPAFDFLGRGFGAQMIACPVAESLQPRLLQFQTNSLESATRNAKALRSALRAVD